MFYSVCFLMFQFYFLVRVGTVRMVKNITNQSSDRIAANIQTVTESRQALSTYVLPVNSHSDSCRVNNAGIMSLGFDQTGSESQFCCVLAA